MITRMLPGSATHVATHYHTFIRKRRVAQRFDHIISSNYLNYRYIHAGEGCCSCCRLLPCGVTGGNGSALADLMLAAS
jgi:hypothetical protein